MRTNTKVPRHHIRPTANNPDGRYLKFTLNTFCILISWPKPSCYESIKKHFSFTLIESESVCSPGGYPQPRLAKRLQP